MNRFAAFLLVAGGAFVGLMAAYVPPGVLTAGNRDEFPWCCTAFLGLYGLLAGTGVAIYVGEKLDILNRPDATRDARQRDTDQTST